MRNPLVRSRRSYLDFLPQNMGQMHEQETTMKSEPLNYECHIDGEAEPFDFHGDSFALARDHVLCCVRAVNATGAKWRKKGAVRWRSLTP